MQGEFRDAGDESIATVLVISTAGCADTTRDPHVDYSGFLGDYSDLMEGDATQAERRVPAVDHRVGGKFLQASHLTSWGEVQDMMKLWAVWGSYNLCKLQERATCLEPKI